ncbi:MAG: leucine-rich repeat protein [Paludibacteraceae bacterium]
MKKLLTLCAALLAAMTMSAENMTCADAAAAALALGENVESTEIVSVEGYITNTNGTVSREQQTFYMDDVKGSGAKTLLAYWANLPADDKETPLAVGDKIILTGKLLHYVSNSGVHTAEIKNGDVTVLERTVVKMDTIQVDACEAIEQGLALNDGEYTDDIFEVSGVVSAVTNTNDNYHSQTFDLECTTQETNFRAYNCTVIGDYVEIGDTVDVLGKLTNYGGLIEIASGKAWITAKYQKPQFTVAVGVDKNCKNMGTVSGSGIFRQGDIVTISATPNSGYHFVEWSDGNSMATRDILLFSDTTLFATFAAGDMGGKCGENLYWTWDKTAKELAIIGTGAMDLETYPAWRSDTYRTCIDTICGIQFTEGITTIAASAFSTIDYNYPTYLVKELIIPASVEVMGRYCFAGLRDIDRIEYLGNTATVEGWAMAGKKVRYLKVPAGFVSELDIQDTLIITNGEASMSYSTCPYVDLSAASNTDMSRIAITYHPDVLRTYILPNGLEVIDDNALRSCRYLSAITIPAGVTYIGVSAFEDCRSMTSVVFAGNKVETIGDWAFYNCHSLRNLTLPEGVVEVGLAAFYGCTYLNELTIPSTMKKIADNGFAGCERMQTMYVNALVPPTIEAKTFEDVDRATPVFVPRGTMERYQADQYWSEFFNMSEYDAPTGNLNVSTDEANGLRKVVRDGQVLILRGDKTYTILGEMIQ